MPFFAKVIVAFNAIPAIIGGVLFIIVALILVISGLNAETTNSSPVFLLCFAGLTFVVGIEIIIKRIKILKNIK